MVTCWAAVTWIERDWVRVAVAVVPAIAFCAAVFGGWWKAGLLFAAAGALFSFYFSEGWEGGFPGSPGLAGWSSVVAAMAAALMTGLGQRGGRCFRTVAWVCFSLFCGGVGARFAGPGTGEIQRGDIDEKWNGLIVSNRHLLAGEEDAHGVRRLELPGGESVPWSIGHAILVSGRGGAWKVLEPGASFLPLRPEGKPVPFWTYLGGGGSGVPPVVAMRTDGLMGVTGHD